MSLIEQSNALLPAFKRFKSYNALDTSQKGISIENNGNNFHALTTYPTQSSITSLPQYGGSFTNSAGQGNLSLDFTVQNNILCTGAEFFKNVLETASSHTVTLYFSSGTFTGQIYVQQQTQSETASGYQQITWKNPVILYAGNSYRISVFITTELSFILSNIPVNTLNNDLNILINQSYYLTSSNVQYPTTAGGSENYQAIDILYKPTGTNTNLFGQSTPTQIVEATSSGEEFGNVFYVNTTISNIRGIRFYKDSNDNTTSRTLNLWQITPNTNSVANIASGFTMTTSGATTGTFGISITFNQNIYAPSILVYGNITYGFLTVYSSSGSILFQATNVVTTAGWTTVILNMYFTKGTNIIIAASVSTQPYTFANGITTFPFNTSDNVITVNTGIYNTSANTFPTTTSAEYFTVDINYSLVSANLIKSVITSNENASGWINGIFSTYSASEGYYMVSFPVTNTNKYYYIDETQADSNATTTLDQYYTYRYAAHSTATGAFPINFELNKRYPIDILYQNSNYSNLYQSYNENGTMLNYDTNQQGFTFSKIPVGNPHYTIPLDRYYCYQLTTTFSMNGNTQFVIINCYRLGKLVMLNIPMIMFFAGTAGQISTQTTNQTFDQFFAPYGYLLNNGSTVVLPGISYVCSVLDGTATITTPGMFVIYWVSVGIWNFIVSKTTVLNVPINSQMPVPFTSTATNGCGMSQSISLIYHLT